MNYFLYAPTPAHVAEDSTLLTAPSKLPFSCPLAPKAPSKPSDAKT